MWLPCLKTVCRRRGTYATPPLFPIPCTRAVKLRTDAVAHVPQAIYADDVHVFDAWNQWQYSGLEAWRAMAAGWFGSLGDDETVEVRFTGLEQQNGTWKIVHEHSSLPIDLVTNTPIGTP